MGPHPVEPTPFNGGIQAPGALEAWGGDRLEWVDLLNLGAPPFLLDNLAEEADWHNFQATVKNFVSGLGATLASLSCAIYKV